VEVGSVISPQSSESGTAPPEIMVEYTHLRHVQLEFRKTRIFYHDATFNVGPQTNQKKCIFLRSQFNILQFSI